MSESAALLPGCCNNQPVPLSVAGRTAFALGARGLLEGPVVVLTGARLPRPDSHRLAVRAAGLLARDKNFGIVVYGYGSYTSYMYPGGLNLETVVITPE